MDLCYYRLKTKKQTFVLNYYLSFENVKMINFMILFLQYCRLLCKIGCTNITQKYFSIKYLLFTVYNKRAFASKRRRKKILKIKMAIYWLWKQNCQIYSFLFWLKIYLILEKSITTRQTRHDITFWRSIA